MEATTVSAQIIEVLARDPKAQARLGELFIESAPMAQLSLL